MNIHRPTVLAICFFAGSFLGATITARSQRQAQTVADLVVQKHDLSKMDWVLLDARVTALEATPLTDPSRVVSPVDFTYDETAKKIVARGFVNSEWLSKANAEQIKTMFTLRAADFCGVAVAGSLMKEGSPTLSWQSNCSVRFVTWAPQERSSRTSSKDVAFFDNGQLVLK